MSVAEGPGHWWWRQASWCVVFALAVLIGRASRLDQSEIALVWPAAAVAAVWVLTARSRGEVIVAGGLLVATSWLVTSMTGAAVGLSLGFALVNLVIGAGTASLLSQRGRVQLREPVDLAWMLLSVACATGVAALLGGALLHHTSGADTSRSAVVFWARNGVTTFLGVSVLATLPPPLRSWSGARRAAAAAVAHGIHAVRSRGRSAHIRARLRQVLGDLAVWAFAVTTYALVFVVNAGSPLAFFVLPVGVLIALRWSTALCVWHMLASDVFVLVATLNDRGPFLTAEPVTRAILAQGLIGCALLIVLTVSLYRDSRDRLLADLNTAHRELQEAAEQLRHSALHDSLTGLANRERLLGVLGQHLGRAARNDTHVGVVFLDLNGFKAVNDTHGHAEGDLLLDAVATRLRAFLRSGDFVARLGGDEFVMLCPDLGPLGQLEAIADRLDDTLAQPYHLSSGRVHDQVSASLGTARSTRASTAEDLLSEADAAMYETKRRHHAGRVDAHR